YGARPRPRHARWVGMGALSKGNANQCANHQGASGYLLKGGQAASAAQWWEALQALMTACPEVQVQRLSLPVPCSRLQTRDAPVALQTPAAYPGDFDRTWGIGSFTALVRGAASKVGAVLPVSAMRPADDEHVNAEVLPARPSLLTADASAPVWHRFQRGELVGNFIHDQLEWLEGEDFALPPDGQGALAEQLLRRCERAGRGEFGSDVVTWLTQAVHLPLPLLDCSLAQIATRQPEMEFWLPLAQLPADCVDAICRAHILPGHARPALPQRSLHGMLMGFADLVLVHEGRYWVMDYKTNHLGPDGSAYTEAALAQSMLQHRYDVQAALYMLALHRLLQSRLGDAYVPQEQLGGALYFFLRGLDGPTRGVHHVPPCLPVLDALEQLLDEVTA
ncbi:MAG: PD-(D/E)XK nuclease family protein, partial [Comamonas sp.]|nr:PD-(D/E)XK nuclease family protein [Candidatus Comamonas equi]